MDMTKPREDLNPGRVKKVALVHEWLTTYAGSDKVLAVIISLFPDADLFCLIDHLPENQNVLSAEIPILQIYLSLSFPADAIGDRTA